MEYLLNMKVNKTKIRLKIRLKNKMPVDYRFPDCRRVVGVVVIVINKKRLEF